MLNDTKYKNTYMNIEFNVTRKFLVRPNFSTCQILQQSSLLFVYQKYIDKASLAKVFVMRE